MADGISLHIGLNRVDPSQYDGWDGALSGCEFDAQDMAELAGAQGFEPTVLLTETATADEVIRAIEDAAQRLKAGDMFLLSNSSHGGQVPDGNHEESDQLDETWLMYDRQIVDDELYDLWSHFAAGVRIIVLSDSCHSGTVARQLRAAVRPEALMAVAGAEAASATSRESGQIRLKGMPDELIEAAYEKHRDVYDRIQRDMPAGELASVKAAVLLLSGCQDNQTSADGDRNGLFTQTLKAVWKEGRFRGSYISFHRRMQALMPPWQSPNLFPVGATDRALLRQRPFTLDP